MSNHDHEAQTLKGRKFYREQVNDEERNRLKGILDHFNLGIRVNDQSYIGYTHVFPSFIGENSQELFFAGGCIVTGISFLAVGAVDSNSGFLIAGSLLLAVGIIIGVWLWRKRPIYIKYDHIIVENNNQDYVLFYDRNGDLQGSYMVSYYTADQEDDESINLGKQVNYNQSTHSFEGVDNDKTPLLDQDPDSEA